MLSCKVWTHFHKFGFYALFKSAAQFVVVGQQRVKQTGIWGALWNIFDISCPNKCNENSSIEPTRRQRLSWHRHSVARFAYKLLSTSFVCRSSLHCYNSQIFFHHQTAMSSAYQPVGICPEKQLQSSQQRFFNCHNLRLNVLAFQLVACSWPKKKKEKKFVKRNKRHPWWQLYRAVQFHFRFGDSQSIGARLSREVLPSGQQWRLTSWPIRATRHVESLFCGFWEGPRAHRWAGMST